MSYKIKNKKISLLGVLLFLISLVSYYFIENEFSPSDILESVDDEIEPDLEDGQYKVVRVIDGDSLVIKMDEQEEKVRLIGINTPETVDPRKPVECYGKEASAKAKEVLENQVISLEFDSSQGERDKYSRLLAYVFLQDGTNFNEMMIKEGFAYEYTYQKPYKYQEEFKKAQDEAEELELGLWGGECQND